MGRGRQNNNRIERGIIGSCLIVDPYEGSRALVKEILAPRLKADYAIHNMPKKEPTFFEAETPEAAEEMIRNYRPGLVWTADEFDRTPCAPRIVGTARQYAPQSVVVVCSLNVAPDEEGQFRAPAKGDVLIRKLGSPLEYIPSWFDVVREIYHNRSSPVAGQSASIRGR